MEGESREPSAVNGMKDEIKESREANAGLPNLYCVSEKLCMVKSMQGELEGPTTVWAGTVKSQ
eukprot:scaffold176818_cov15-Tisochrysis_lutea.AAC.2